MNRLPWSIGRAFNTKQIATGSRRYVSQSVDWEFVRKDVIPLCLATSIWARKLCKRSRHQGERTYCLRLTAAVWATFECPISQ